MVTHTIGVTNTSILHPMFKGCNVFHKPTDHGAWLEHKTALNGWCDKGGKEKDTTPASAPTPKPSLTPGAAKLSLAKSLQEA